MDNEFLHEIYTNLDAHYEHVVDQYIQVQMSLHDTICRCKQLSNTYEQHPPTKEQLDQFQQTLHQLQSNIEKMKKILERIQEIRKPIDQLKSITKDMGNVLKIIQDLRIPHSN